MHLRPVFAACPAHVSGLSGALFARGLCLPSDTGLSREDLERIIACALPPAGSR